MATFLELVNDLERESGTIYQGSRLATVIDAPNRQEKMVEWVKEAWRLIQLARSDWPWMKREFEGALIPAKARYSASDLAVTNFSRWAKAVSGFEPFSLYPDGRRQDEKPIPLIPWNAFKMQYDRGVHDAMQPVAVSVDQERKLCFGPTPDAPYRVRGEYFRTAQILEENDDVPICPEEHHQIIVWRAVMLMGDHDEAPAVVSTGSAKYQFAFRALVDGSTENCEL